MRIVIPMAGLSSRFTQSGYSIPKYMLYIYNKSLFNLSVSSFRNYFSKYEFLFIARNIYDTKKFIDSECKLLGIKNYEIIMLDNPTLGQSDTVMKGLTKSKNHKDGKICIFNIDTIRSGLRFKDRLLNKDGYLEVFIGDGENWSYAKTESMQSHKVIETAEKKQISNYCSTGLYYFKNSKKFIDSYETYIKSCNGKIEHYIAPLYNIMISNGDEIYIDIVSKNSIKFCGTPKEYKDYMKLTAQYKK